MSTTTQVPFDPDNYDNRTGYPPNVTHLIGKSITTIATTFQANKGIIVDLGAGTGQIGAAIINSTINDKIAMKYIGLDISADMISIFYARLIYYFPSVANASNWDAQFSPTPFPELFVTDLNANDSNWPGITSNSVRMFFGARSVHWLDRNATAQRVWESATNDGYGSWFVSGRIKMAANSSHEMIKDYMQALMIEYGYTPKDGEADTLLLFDTIIDHHPNRARTEGTRLPTTVVASWYTLYAPMDQIEDWKSKKGLGGEIEITEEDKAAILLEVEVWVNQTWPNKGYVGIQILQQFVLDGVLLYGNANDGKSFSFVDMTIVVASILFVVILIFIALRYRKRCRKKERYDEIEMKGQEPDRVLVM